MTSRSRAATLVVALGVLTLLTLLAVAFVSVTRLELTAVENYFDGLRATEIAQAGMARAVEGLTASARSKPWEDARDPWVFRDAHDQGTGHGVDIEASPYPSFRTSLTSGRVVSGVLGGTHIAEGDTYIIKILDCASMVNINGPQASLPITLESLGRALVQYYQDLDGRSVSNPIPPGKGVDILQKRDARPGGVYSDKSELDSILGHAQYLLVADFVTTHGWADPTTVRAGDAASDLAQAILVRKPPVAEPRFPVCINTAPRPVLTAVLAGLTALQLGTEPDGSPPVAIGGAVPIHLAKRRVDPVSYELAARLAKEIDGRRRANGPFRSWGEVDAYLRQYMANVGSPALSDVQRRVIMANVNPNAHFNTPSAAASLYSDISKLDLLTTAGPGMDVLGGTTELSFSSMGNYEVTVLSQIMMSSGRLAAERRVRVVQRIYDVVRVTGQAAFEAARVAAGGSVTTPETVGLGTAATSDGAIVVAPTAPSDSSSDRSMLLAFDGVLSARYSRGNGQPSSAVASATTRTKLSDRGILDGGDLAPDGVVTIRAVLKDPSAPDGAPGKWRQLRYDDPANLPSAEAGAVELWVKWLAPPAEGSDEVLLFMTAPAAAPNAGGNQTGITWRLEKYGDRLVSTRFFWGYPMAVLSPYALSYSERVFRIPSTWRAQEWHHIGITWVNGLQQTLYVDNESPVSSGADLPNKRLNAQRVVRGRVIGEDWTNFQFRLASSDPGTKLFVGGYTYMPPSGAPVGQIYNVSGLAMSSGNEVHRYSNTVIDDCVLYTNSGVPMSGKSRFQVTTSSPPSYRMRVCVPSIAGRPPLIGSIAWTPVTTPDLPPVDLVMRYSKPEGGDLSDVPSDRRDGSGVALNAVYPRGTIDLEFQLRPRYLGSVVPLSGSPALDDITVTVIAPRALTEPRTEE